MVCLRLCEGFTRPGLVLPSHCQEDPTATVCPFSGQPSAAMISEMPPLLVEFTSTDQSLPHLYPRAAPKLQ